MSDPIYANGTLVIRHADPGASVSAVCPFEAPQGLLVTFDPTDPTKYVKATGARGRRLERPVVDKIPLTDIVFNNQLFRPDLIGSACSSRQSRVEEVEGAEVLLLEGTGAITGDIAPRTPLSTVDGKLRIAQAGVAASEGQPAVLEDEIYGYLVTQLTPEIDGNTVRILVETLW